MNTITPVPSWQNEPDRVEWLDPVTKLPCMMMRSEMGTWCGYIGLSPNHPWWGTSYEKIEPYPDVHGGLTFSDKRLVISDSAVLEQLLENGIIPDDLWWIGFDCAHFADLSPRLYDWKIQVAEGKEYRDARYVTQNVVNLALQAAVSAKGTKHDRPRTG